MNTPLALMVLCAGALSLVACDKTTPTPPTPTVVAPDVSKADAAAGSFANPSVSSAGMVYPPANAASAQASLEVSDGTRKPAQDARATPKPGQNNDHSAPLGPAQGASAR